MLTNEDLYKKYGDDIVFLFKAEEPYTEMLGNPGGVLIERDNKVLCYECEEWFEELGYHLRKDHKIEADEYKQRYGFNKSAPLCTRAKSEEKRQLALAAIDKKPELLEKASMGRQKALHTVSMRGKIQPRKRMQGLNVRNACPEQIKQRYRLLQLKYGNDVGLNTIRKIDSGVEAWGVRHYGSWNKFKEALGEPVDTTSYAKDSAALIYDLREYVLEHGKLPWDTYTKRRLHGYAHSQMPYISRWDRMSDALIACGIESIYVNVGGVSMKKFQLDPEYEKELKDSLLRLQARAEPKFRNNDWDTEKPAWMLKKQEQERENFEDSVTAGVEFNFRQAARDKVYKISQRPDALKWE